MWHRFAPVVLKCARLTADFRGELLDGANGWPRSACQSQGDAQLGRDSPFALDSDRQLLEDAPQTCPRDGWAQFSLQIAQRDDFVDGRLEDTMEGITVCGNHDDERMEWVMASERR